MCERKSVLKLAEEGAGSCQAALKSFQCRLLVHFMQQENALKLQKNNND